MQVDTGGELYRRHGLHMNQKQRSDSSKITNEVEDIFWVKKLNLIKLK